MLDMTDQELNRALAEFMGYRLQTLEFDDIYYSVANPHGFPGPYRYTVDDAFLCAAPEYSSDPAASLEVQAVACEVHPNTYIRYLEKIKWGQSTGWKVSNRVVAQLCNASPRERAEAAYLTLSIKD
ncbi:hypothetical protein MKY98_02905 [Paenibacillus sp. FSL M8-0228]|uniref:hypothetical protein n=1 Tax=Paenibacillus sp. FSL M8-0228 TaxID=2921620 RepID=UPI0030F595A2